MDASFASRGLPVVTREALWTVVDSILAHGPTVAARSGATGLALGYVQSGKTTAITALIAAAADSGYRVIVALLGSTNLLLEQNQSRLLSALGIDQRQDYRWVSMVNPAGATKAKEMANWLARGRTVLIPVLKHAGRIDSVASVLVHADVTDLPVLIVDDEADQASLNTEVNRGQESRTYAALTQLRNAAARHLYVQFTATPYAPLLLEPDDHLRPDFIELLQPGEGYTGGREFFVDYAHVVVRPIPTLDEQRPKSLPTQLPKSLVEAFGSFVAGTALLLGRDPAATPVSMLVHSTQRNDVQARYHFLLQRLVRRWAEVAETATDVRELPPDVATERLRITSLGAPELDDAAFLDKVRLVLGETTLWLVNSASDVNNVDWRVAPVHVLVGGNKLDRGFTVEGLTVTYMNRPASDQIDTLEQRARAFGYRSDLLPYCQFFATPRTLKVLRETVDTEYDLRANLRDWLADGHDVSTWAREVGLLLPQGTKPSRQNVLTALTQFNERPSWHQLRRPSLDVEVRTDNEKLVVNLGLLSAPRESYGRLSHPTLRLPLADITERLLRPWSGVDVGTSPGWRHHELLNLLERLPQQGHTVPLMLMEHPEGGPRRREWDPELGFINLMQGSDPVRKVGQPWYPGDRAIGGIVEDPEQVVVQVHRVTSSQAGLLPELFTLAIHAGRRGVVRKV
ncbi:Z1 domain-containing protein [Terrabacter sp. GCM10028922]|uniref:Z1 domain-containing protein n=1 Tax=Terrabacter sp. GCM10028922 TaxID=3273428 RepID=UPI00361D5805